MAGRRRHRHACRHERAGRQGAGGADLRPVQRPGVRVSGAAWRHAQGAVVESVHVKIVVA